MSRGDAIAANIARQIVRNKTKRRFSGLYADALHEEMMSTSTSSNGLNTSKHADASLDRSHIGSPADGRKLNGSGTSGSGINSGIAASQNSEVRPISVKQVDHVALEGSNKGDHRFPSKDTAAASLASAADNGGPRNRVGQFDKPSTGAPEKFGSGSGESEYEGAGA